MDLQVVGRAATTRPRSSRSSRAPVAGRPPGSPLAARDRGHGGDRVLRLRRQRAATAPKDAMPPPRASGQAVRRPRSDQAPVDPPPSRHRAPRARRRGSVTGGRVPVRLLGGPEQAAFYVAVTVGAAVLGWRMVDLDRQVRSLGRRRDRCSRRGRTARGRPRRRAAGTRDGRGRSAAIVLGSGPPTQVCSGTRRSPTPWVTCRLSRTGPTAPLDFTGTTVWVTDGHGRRSAGGASRPSRVDDAAQARRAAATRPGQHLGGDSADPSHGPGRRAPHRVA